MTGFPKRFVYILKSERDNRPYFGITSNVARRFETLRFERYLKSGSGRALARRHLL